MSEPGAILDFSKAPSGIDWGVALVPQPQSSPRYISDIGGVVLGGKTAQEAFDKALAEYERMLEQEADYKPATMS